MPDRVIDSARLRELAEWCEEATNVKHYTVLQKALYADLARVLRAVLKAEAWLSRSGEPSTDLPEPSRQIGFDPSLGFGCLEDAEPMLETLRYSLVAALESLPSAPPQENVSDG